MEDDRRRDIALFRYSLVREAADPELSPAERGVLVRRLAAREHVGPGGKRGLSAAEWCRRPPERVVIASASEPICCARLGFYL